MVQGTFWRAAAERYAETLEEGKVYIFHRFKVILGRRR
jgi:replication factor A1